jgi:hypothetical protein
VQSGLASFERDPADSDFQRGHECALRNMQTDLLCWPPTPISEIEAAIQRLVEEGLVEDSGRRRWSERTGRYEIVWVATDVSGTC